MRHERTRKIMEDGSKKRERERESKKREKSSDKETEIQGNRDRL